MIMARSIRTKLLFYFLIILVISSTVVGVASYTIAIRNLKEKVSDSYEKSMELIANNIQDAFMQVQRLSDFIYVNNTVKKIVTTEYASYENIKSREEIGKVFDNTMVSNWFQNINTIKIINMDSKVYTYVAYGQYDSYDNKSITDSQYFRDIVEGTDTAKQIITGRNHDFRKSYFTPEESFSIFRPICNEQFSEIIGVMFINIDPELFRQCVGESGINSTMKIEILDDENRTFYSTEEIHTPWNDTVLNATENLRYEDKETGQIVFCRYLNNGWKAVGSADTKAMVQENRQILIVSLWGVVGAAGLTIIAWLILSHLFIKPIYELRRVMKTIRDGEFNVRADVVSRDEIGALTEDFNYMIDQVQLLVKKQIEDSVRLKDAQHLALQAQINPHFLYNTLNSIRWMAIIQKADNIKNAVDALARLLRSTAQQADKVTIRESIETLKSYADIQQMAYLCKFELICQVDARVENCRCMNFLLQPLVENSICHGIEPKAGMGTIWVTIYPKELEGTPYLYFEIKDDGVGMSQKRLEELKEDCDVGSSGFSGIGVKNVNDRLRMIYGEECGLNFESEEGAYLKVWFVIPWSVEGESDV